MIAGLIILYSASNQNTDMLVRQSIRLLFAWMFMIACACIPPHQYKLITPWFFCTGMLLLLAVMIMGKIGKGAQRWLDLGLFRFQPSEIMKLAVPMMAAWYLDRQKPPIELKHFAIAGLLLFIPTILIAKQPDLGTAIMVAASGLCVIFMAGISVGIIAAIALSIGLSAPIIWHF